MFDERKAEHAVRFINNLKHTKGQWHGKNFDLLPWQDTIIRDIFGTVKPNGYRQYNTAYVEIPKKNGKSELAAAIALLTTCADGEWGAEVYRDMSPPSKELMKLTLEGRLAHGGNPVLRWMADNVFVKTDPAGNIKPDKEKSTEKIDGIIAAVMALDRAIRNQTISGSVYDGRGLLIL